MQNKQKNTAEQVEAILGPDAAKFFKPNKMTYDNTVDLTNEALGYIARKYKAD